MFFEYNDYGDTMKRKYTFKRFLLTILTVAIIAIFGVNVIRSNSIYQSIDHKFFGFFSMIKYGLIDYPVQTIRSVSDDIATIWNVRYENDLLRKDLDKSYQISQLLKSQQEEIERLKGLTNIKALYSDYTLINGQVLNRSIEKWDSIVSINIGRNDNVAVGDGVVSEFGIIGRVVEVFDNNALVSLIIANNDNSKVSVRIEVNPQEYVFGILDSYDATTKEFQVNLLEASDKIIANQPVSVSGVGGVFAMGLKVGNVTAIRNISGGVGKIVLIKSDVNFNDLRYVAVVKK